MPVLFSTTTTAQNIMDGTAQDVRQTLSSIDPSQGQLTLLDYVDRVSKEMLRASRWRFLLSSPKLFMTQLGVSNYWIGPSGSAPLGVYDTGLGLTDLRIIKPRSVYDRTNFLALGHVDESPLASKLAYPDGTSRPGRPNVWRQDESSPNILNIYPAPDNQALYSPQPEPPFCTTVAGGSLPARMYFMSVTFVDSFGSESTSPLPMEIFVPANFLVVVQPPQQPLVAGTTGVKYDRYNVYGINASTNEIVDFTAGSVTKQAGPISVSTTWTEPGSGLTSNGANPPSTNSMEPITGYVMEFRYYSQRTQVTSTSQVLQIPDDYKDVATAGVNYLAFKYLTRPQEAGEWHAIYKDGISQMIRDTNFMDKGPGYIRPDGASIGQFLPGISTSDLAFVSS